MNNFEKWLNEIIKSDPHFMITLVCVHYDDCICCPLRNMCPNDGAEDKALEWLLAPSDEYEERTK